ncbi:unnamed protein product, partial [Prorocentrum cordatum]
MPAKRPRLDADIADSTALILSHAEVVAALPSKRLYWESPLTARIQSILSAARRHNLEPSEVARGLLIEGLGGAVRASLASQAASLNTSEWAFKSRMGRAAAWAWLLDRWHRHHIVKLIALRARSRGAHIELIQACDHVSYDETPLELQSMSEHREVSRGAPSALPPAAGSEVATMTSRALAVALLRGAFRGFKPKTITKLFATKARYCHLVRLTMNGQMRYVYLVGDVVCQVQPLASTSAACQALALMESGSASLSESTFSHKVRITDADGHRSNRAGERILDRKREPGWVRLFYQCQAHSIVRAHNIAMKHVDVGIKGVIHLSLCFRVAGSKHSFNTHLWKEVHRRLRVREGSPSNDDVIYNHVVLKSFVSGDGQKTRRRVLFTLLPSSSMADTREITIWVDSAAGLDEDVLKTSVADSMVDALMPRALRVLIRSKWGTSESAICDAGLIEMRHGLLGPAFTSWCRSFGRGRSKQHALAALVDGRVDDVGAGECEDDDMGAHEGAGGDAEAAGVGSRRERLNKHMAFAMDFMSNKRPVPHTFFVLASNILRPLQAMLRKHCYLTSKEFEKKERVHAAKRTAEGTVGINRSFPVTVLADGVLETRCFEKMMLLLFTPAAWHLIRPEEVKNRNTSLAFIMISDALATITQEVALVNQGFPTRLFQLFQQPELGPTMEAAPDCMKDAFTKELQSSCRLGGEECLMRLAAMAMLIQGNTVPNEVFNAQMRKIVKSRTQCPQFKAVDLSTACVGVHSRAKTEDVTRPRHGPVHEPRAGGGSGAHAAERRRYQHEHHTGAWGVFQHEQGINDMREVSARYRALPPAERARLAEEGRRAAARARDGSRALPPTQRQVGMHRNARLATTAIERFAGRDPDDTVDFLIRECGASGTSLKDTLSTVASYRRGLARHQRLQEEADNQLLELYRDDESRRVVPELVHAIPSLGPVSGVLRCLPPVLGAAVVERDASSSADDVALLEEAAHGMSVTHQSNVQQAAEMMWNHMRRLLPDDPELSSLGDAADDPAEQFKDGECLRYGMCVCGAVHDGLRALRRKVFQATKMTFSKASPQTRGLLVCRRAIARFIWLADDSDEDELMNDLGLEPLYWHLSGVKFSPYELMMQPMTPASPAERHDACATDDEHCLKGCGLSPPTFIALASVPLQLRIMLDFLIVEVHDRERLAFVPAVVIAEELAGVDPFQ